MKQQLILAAAVATTCLASASSANQNPGYVIHISVDGLGGLALQELLESEDPTLESQPTDTVPNFRRLFTEGAGTLNARADAQNTKTLPNHSSMLSGRPVLPTPGLSENAHHGWTSNATPAPGETLHNTGNVAVDYVSSVFDVVHDHGYSTALFTSKSKFVLFDESWDELDGALDLVGEDNGRDKIDEYYYASTGTPTTADNMQAALLDKLSLEHYRYTFVHYVNADAAGHTVSFSSNGYKNAIRRVDSYLSEILALVESDPILAGNTTLILTADHGGTGTLHEEFDKREHYTVPFVAWGAAVPTPGDLYEFNEISRVDPGANHEAFNTPLGPIRNMESGNLALAVLGLPAIPGSSANVAHDLSIAPEPMTHVYGCGLNPAGSLSVLAGEPVFGTQMTLGVDNPLGTQASGALPLIFFSMEPAELFPCGVGVAGFSMAGPAELGEVLISLEHSHLLESAQLTGEPWIAGAPSELSLSIPDSPNLAGVHLYLQGALWDASAPQGVEIGLTNGLALQLGT